MKCPVCSHVYPDALSQCSRCGRVAPEQTAGTTTGSTLIEFPTSRHVKNSLPDWRVELNEKVRAIKARRNMEALVGEASTLREADAPPRLEQVVPPEPEPEPDDHQNPIVRAALNRVRRASENAARVVHQSSSQSAAAARLPVEPVRVPVPEPPPRIVQVPDVVPARPSSRPSLGAKPSQPSLLFDPAELLEGFDDDLNPVTVSPTVEHSVPVLDETPMIAPAPLGRRFVAAFVDGAIILLVTVPFAATAYATDADFRRPEILVLLGVALVALSLFYVGSTVTVAGRTVGMMLRRLHIETTDGRRPDGRRVALRALGYMVCVATGGLGFAWAFVSRSRTGLHDLMSGTRVVED